MSKKKTNKRLESLFEDVKKEEATPEKRARKNEGALIPSTVPLPFRPRAGSQTKIGSTLLEESPAMATAISNNSGAMALAFRTDEKSWATLRVVDEASPRTWAMEEQMLVKQVADQLSLALENAHLFQEEQKRSAELQAISEIASSVSTILDFEKLLDEFVYQTRKQLNLYHAHIFILENDQSTLDVKACGWVEEGKRGTHGARTIDINQTTSLVATAARTLQPVIANDVHKEPNWLPNPLLPDIRSEMAVPVISRDKLIGVLNVHSDRTNAFTDTDAAIITTLASQIGTIIENARLFQEEQKRRHEAETLREASSAVASTLDRRNQYLAAAAEIGRLVTSTLDLNTIFSRTVNLIAERFGHYHSAIFVIEETGFNAIMQEAVGPAAEEMKRLEYSLPVNEKSIVGKVAFNGEPVIVNNTALDATHKPNPLLPDTQAEAAIPLRVGSRIIGALDIQSTSVGAFTPDDIAVLQILADQIAIAIDNARSYELSQQAVMEMREIDRLKSQFLANMSHELRTPLNSIIGFSRVILKGIDGTITELQQQDLTAIYNSGQHLLGLINDVLDLAKIEAGKMELAFDEVNIADLINSVASTTSGLIKDKPIKFVKNIQQDLPPVRADAIRVRQIMINLISNAAKFTEAGDIVLDAHLQSGPAGRAEILISVTDTGPGITAEDQAKLFQAFSQVDDSPTRKTGGTGLGLSISQQLVQMHGGQIGVHSVVGKGSTFYFTLPVYRTKDEPSQPGSAKVILAVDDDPQVISLYERYLQPQGYQVISITDPTKAKERAKQLNPYAITLDIMMPGYDGWSVLADLKSDADTREIPVVICSIIEEQERGFSLGAADYLLKPILEEDLLGALDRLNADGSIREVLIIDDDQNSLRLMEKIFEDQGRYKTILAEGGKKGWDSITKHAPQAVILDLFMPEMDGFSILEKMRENARLRDVPVIVVSGGDLTPEQYGQLSEFGQRLVNKASLNEKDFINNVERALKRAKQKK